MVPSFENINQASMSLEEFNIVTQNGKEQIAMDSALQWTWKSRREAQPILDFLYLGPSSLVKDREWLKGNGFTMLLAVRTSWMAGVQLLSVDRVAEELGIQAEHVDVSDNQGLIGAFPQVARKINDHMVHVHREHNNRQNGGFDSAMSIDASSSGRGKILVFCESGNERSAAIVVAYLMAVYGVDITTACQFVQYRRFSVGLDDNIKQLLHTYQGILQAQRTVNTFNMNPNNTLTVSSGWNNGGGGLTHKRSIEDAMNVDDADDGIDGAVSQDTMLDAERYRNRAEFVPFVDGVDNF